jgi:uncharacterized iron-regulated protein
MPKQRPLIALLLLTASLLLSACSITHVVRVADREVIEVESMIDEFSGARVVLVGESHDTGTHHQLQLDIIKRLVQQGDQVAIGMEMFEEASQKALDAWSAGKMPEQEFRRVFERNWRNISWEYYSGILRFARENHLPLVALNAPRGVVQKVSRQGVAVLSKDDLRQLPPGIDLEVSDSYLDFMKSAYTAHGRTGANFRYLGEAQMLRNRVMAFRIREYLAGHPKAMLVVLAGGIHVREQGGIPEQLGTLPYRVVLPVMPGLNAETVTPQDGDYLIQERYSWFDALF